MSIQNLVDTPNSYSPLWDAQLDEDRFVLVPQLIAQHENPHIAAVYIALVSSRPLTGEILTTVNRIAQQIDVRTTNKSGIRSIKEALQELYAMGILENLIPRNLEPIDLTPNLTFQVYMPAFQKTRQLGSKNPQKPRWGCVYITDLTAYSETGFSQRPKFHAYLRELTRLRLRMYVNDQRASLYLGCGAVMMMDTFLNGRPRREDKMTALMEAYREAEVLAWATFERPAKERRASRMIAVVNYGDNNEERLRRAIRISRPSAYSKIQNVHMFA